MSRNQRIGLLVAAGVVAIVAIVVAVASGGGDDSSSGGDNATSSSFKLQIKDEKPVGGVQTFKVKKGDPVTIVVSVDAHDVIHLHGYDIEKDAEPGKPARFKFTANMEGIFEMESHVAEDAGKEPQMAKLMVEPD